MKIAIIGAGFSALSLAYDLSKNSNLDITLIDMDSRPGGMTAGFKKKNWDWTVEDHYHHVFDSDKAFRNFLSDLGLSDQMIYKKTKSSTYYNGQVYLLDSPLSLLFFKEISFLSRLRTGAVLAFLKLLPSPIFLERYAASIFLKKTMGQESWKVIWEPLFKSKFGKHKDQINMSWFWARVNPRSQTLGYFKGGFQSLADQIKDKLEEAGVKFLFSERVEKIYKENEIFTLFLQNSKTKKKTQKNFDLVISTLPSTLFKKIVDLEELKNSKLEGLASMTILLRLKEKFLKDGTYWMNINEQNWPFVAIVEHDNFMDASHYNNESLVYLGRYLELNDREYQKSAKELLADYSQYLKKISPDFEKNLIDYQVAKTDFGQPITKLRHSQILPSFKTSIENLYWVSMQHVYPFDRGINHAVKKSKEFFTWLKKEQKLV